MYIKLLLCVWGGAEKLKADVDTTAVSKNKTLLEVSFAAFVLGARCLGGARTLNVEYFLCSLKDCIIIGHHFVTLRVLLIPVNFIFDPMPSIYFK